MVIYNIYIHLLSQPPNPSPPFKSSSHVPIHTFGVSGSSAFRFAAPPPSMMFCADLFLPPKKRYGIFTIGQTNWLKITSENAFERTEVHCRYISTLQTLRSHQTW